MNIINDSSMDQQNLIFKEFQSLDNIDENGEFISFSKDILDLIVKKEKTIILGIGSQCTYFDVSIGIVEKVGGRVVNEKFTQVLMDGGVVDPQEAEQVSMDMAALASQPYQSGIMSQHNSLLIAVNRKSSFVFSLDEQCTYHPDYVSKKLGIVEGDKEFAIKLSALLKLIRRERKAYLLEQKKQMEEILEEEYLNNN